MQKIKAFFNDNIALAGLLVVWLIGILVNRNFMSVGNMNSLLRAASYMGFIGVGMTFVILCGSIDLSVGAVFALSGYYMLYMSQRSVLLAFIVPVVISLVIGLINGVLVSYMHIPSFIATLATQMFVRGWAQQLTHETTYAVRDIPKVIVMLARDNVLGIVPIPLLMFVAVSVLAAFILKKRFIGRSMYIVGGNNEAANMMGINVNRTFIIAHMFCAVLSCGGGMISSARVGAASPLAGSGYEMYAIAAVVLGGALLTGGVGKVSGTFIGVLIMSSFSNIFSMQKWIDAVWQDVVVGAVLLIVVMIQAIIRTGVPSGKGGKKHVQV